MNSKWKGDSWEYLTTIDQKLEDKYVTMAEILRDNGYVTVAFQANVTYPLSLRRDKVGEFCCPLALDQVELWFAFHFTLSFPTRFHQELKVERR